MALNLAPIIPAIFTGPNGERLTADQIKRRQEIAESLMAQATDTSPNAGGWASIAAKGLAGFQAGRERRSADNASSVNAAASQKNITSLLGNLVGGSPAAAPAMGGSPAAAATGVGAELAATSPNPAVSTVDISGDKQTFVASLLPAAIEESKRTGVDPRIIVAQAAQETGWGRSAPGNNYFGIKSHGQSGGNSMMTNEVINGKTVRIRDSFRQFESPADSVRGYGEFILQNPRYKPLREAQGLDAQLEALQASGYATDPNYSRSVGAIARGIQLPTAEAAIETIAPQGSDYNSPMMVYDQNGARVESQTAQPSISAGSDYNSPMIRYDEQGARVERPYSGGASFDVSRFGGTVPPLPPPTTIQDRPVASVAAALAAQPAAGPQQQMAPVMPQQMPQPAAPTLPPINPAVIETLSSPYASPEEKAVAQALLGDYQQKQAVVEKQALAQQQRQAEIARRQGLAPQLGINPVYAQDDALWEGAAGNIFAPPSTSTVNGVVIDNRTGQPIYQAPAQNYRQVTGPEAAALGLDPTKAYNIGPDLKATPVDSGGTSINVDTGTIPPGYRAVRDAQGRVTQYEPIPGGPAAMDAATLERTGERQAGARETASRVVTDAATRALEAVNAPGLPATGVAGRAMSVLPESNAAEVRRQVDVLKSNATVENLTAMRAASPTGGALGSVTEKEGAMLAAKSGTLDPDSPNFQRDLKDYTRTMLEVIHGPQVGKEIFNTMTWPGEEEIKTDIPGVKIRRKAD